MPTPTAPLYVLRLPVRWADMDALGHVNNAVYFTYFEQARIDALRALAEDGADWPGPPDQGPVLVAADTAFRRPVVYPATVVVQIYLGRVGRTSLELRCTLTVEGDADTVYAGSDTTLVWVSHETGRPVPLPDALRAALEGVPAPPEADGAGS